MATMTQVNMLNQMCVERGLSTVPIETERLNGTLTNARVQYLFKLLKTKPKVPAAPKPAPVQEDFNQAWAAAKTQHAEREAEQEAAAYLNEPDFCQQPVVKPIAKPAKKLAAAEGGYQIDGQIYKVKTGSSGYRYALILAGRTPKGKPHWEIVKGMVFELTAADKMTREQVKAFGDLYQHCIFCGRELTVPESIDRGCGWKCATKHGLA